MKKAVLFVHGLAGGMDTWGAFKSLIEGEDELDYDPFFYVYPSALLRIFPLFQSKYGDIRALSNGLKTYIDYTLDEYDEIVLVAHSLGGLIVRQYLLDQKIASKKTKTKKVIFYAVPQEGTELAKVASLISFGHRHLKQLCNNSQFLDALNDLWATTKIENDYEFKIILATEDKVVSPQSAKSNFRHLNPQNVNGKDHRTIVKPIDKNDLSFIILKVFLCQEVRISRDRPRGAIRFEEWLEIDDVRPFFPDEKRAKVLSTLENALLLPRNSIRLVGLSGLGKTRVAIEALKRLPQEKIESLVYCDVSSEPSDLVLHVHQWINNGYSGILVADNCSLELHDKLNRVVSRPGSKLSLLTLDSDLGRIGDGLHIELGRLENPMIKAMLTHYFGNALPDIDRIVEFAQGFPQMAILIANARINEEPDLGKLTDDLITRKLLWGASNEINSIDEKVLIGCALFDRFGLESGASEEFQYIAEQIVNISEADFYSCVKRYAARGLIDQRGRYAQLVPKPLAIRLAAQWWNTHQRKAQEALISGMPESMVTSFCDQVEKLDFLPEVKQFTAGLCGQLGPFGEAEVILSDRGSRLFRAFVNVNPDATSSALYRVVSALGRDQLLAIEDRVRRNLVWALEKLCFHSHLFSESGWILLMLAVNENETWSNNATGMFSQLFRIQLSGTGADPKVRLELIQRALKLNDDRADQVIISALEQAISVYGGSRTIGAEYQGTKPPLEEWHPKLWQEIFDYWENVFSILLEMLHRGPIQKEKVKQVIGHSIRGFVGHGRLEMLDKTLRQVVAIEGRFWPSALESLKLALEYDADAMNSNVIETLNGWLDLLKPDESNLEERLKILVIAPPWEHRRDAEGGDVDIAAKNADALAVELAENIEQLIKFIPLLLTGEQRQTYVFGRRLAMQSEGVDSFFNQVITELERIAQPNQSFVRGLLSGIYRRSSVEWDRLLSKFSSRKDLIRFFPDMLCTGFFQDHHLSTLLAHIKKGDLKPASPRILAYGGATVHLSSGEISSFCLDLARFEDEGAWSALDILFMHCFSDPLKFEECKPALKILVTGVSLGEKSGHSHSDLYHWTETVNKLLTTEGFTFCEDICRKLIASTSDGFNHVDIWQSIKPLLLDIMKVHGSKLWPLFGLAIVSSDHQKRYWLHQLLDRENSPAIQVQSVLTVLPKDAIISWCRENQTVGPHFVACCINVFETVDGLTKPTELFIALLEEFGDDARIGSALSANLSTRGWSGSLVPYLQSDRKALEPLLRHSSSGVHTWVIKHISNIDVQIEHESVRDAEQDLGI